MASIIKADGTFSPFACAGENGTATLEDLQAAVGGYIEVLRLLDGRWLILNEDAKLMGHAVNDVATQMARPRVRENDFIVGTVVLLESDQFD